MWCTSVQLQIFVNQTIIKIYERQLNRNLSKLNMYKSNSTKIQIILKLNIIKTYLFKSISILDYLYLRKYKVLELPSFNQVSCEVPEYPGRGDYDRVTGIVGGAMMLCGGVYIYIIIIPV